MENVLSGILRETVEGQDMKSGIAEARGKIEEEEEEEKGLGIRMNPAARVEVVDGGLGQRFLVIDCGDI